MTHYRPLLADRPLVAFVAVNLLLAVASPARAETATAPTPGRAAGIGAPQAKLELAQGYGVPPADIGDGGESPYRRPQQDSASLLVRIDRLENQLRQVNGQIEQLQFENRKLEDQLRKFQEDVDFRFQDGAGRGAAPGSPPSRPLQKRTDATESPLEPAAQAPRLETTTAPASTPLRAAGRRNDAFDPSEDPNAPGAPRPLGSQAPSAPNSQVAGWNAARGSQARGAQAGLDPNDPDAPLDLSSGRLHGGQSGPTPMPGRPAQGNAAAPASGGAAAGGAAMAAAPVNAVREEFDAALGYYRQREYENAEKSFTAFLQKNPKTKMAPDAIYYLGESFFQRGRQREAAEQYLKLSTQYSSAPRAPEALLRLGQSLYALGAKEQACATFGELARKYPNASPSVKAGAEREGKRAQC